jgi:hypothetical protein
LKGFPEITKVSFSKNQVPYTNINYYDENGTPQTKKGNFIIETDGVALAKVMAV